MKLVLVLFAWLLAFAGGEVRGKVASVTDTAGPARSLAYDARGNTTNDGRNAFAYDHSNQPTGSSTAGHTYAYDGNFKRAKFIRAGATFYDAYSRVTGKLAYRDNVTAGAAFEIETVGPLAVAFLGGAFDRYHHLDHLGTRLASSDAAGAVLERERFTPFGEQIAASRYNNFPLGFTGHSRDAETNLNYMQARFYDPIIGRFLSTDPVGYEDQLNLYAYVANDPVNAFDPDGERTIWLQVDAWVGMTQTEPPYGRPIPGFKGNWLRGRELTAGIYISVPTAKGQRWDLGVFGSYGKTDGAGGGIGADLGSQQGDDRDLDGKTVVYNADVGFGASVIRDGNGNTVGETIGIGPGIGGSRAEVTTGAVGVRDAVAAIGGLFSNESASFSRNQDGSISATISSAGSRITREVICSSNAEGEASCN